jgi:hypothetical protein
MVEKYTISLTVVDVETRELVEEGIVSIQGDETSYEKHLNGDEAITFEVPNGNYAIDAKVPGYSLSKIPNVHVEAVPETIELRAVPE